MKRICRKLTLALLLILSFVLMLGGATALLVSADEGESAAPAEVVTTYGGEESWYTIEYNRTTKKVTVLLDATYEDYMAGQSSDFAEMFNSLAKVFGDVLVEGLFGSAETDSSLGSLDVDRVQAYIRENLSTKQAIAAYLQGDYDVLVQFVVETYIGAHPGEYTEATQMLAYALGEAVETAYAGDEEAIAEFKTQAEEKAGYLVEQVRVNGDEAIMTIVDIIELVNRLTVNGLDVYDGQLSLVALEQVLNCIPSFEEIAGYTNEQMRNLIDLAVSVDTRYGAFEFEVVVGLNGDCGWVRQIARAIADHFNLTVIDNVYYVQMKMPEFVSRAFSEIVKSESIPDKVKLGIFSLFGMTADELLDEVFTYDELIGFLKSLNYQNIFQDFLNADWLKNYFGDFFGDITPEKIDEFLNMLCDQIVPQFKKLGKLSLQEMEDFLAPYLGRSAKTRQAAEKLLDFVTRVEWDKFNAAYIREYLADPDYNESVFKFIDKYLDFEDIYNTFIDYVDRLFSLLPSEAQNGTLLDLYHGEGRFSFEGHLDIDLEKDLESFGLGGVADLLLPFISNMRYRISFNVRLTVPNVYKVSYEVDGETVRSGLLPVGADVALFSDMTELDGFRIAYWYAADDETKAPLTVMPEKDVVVRPFIQITLTEQIDGEDETNLDVVYDYNAEGYVLSVLINGPEADYTYAWYKDGAPYAGEVNADGSLTVKNVKDSGTYYVVVTDPATGSEATSRDFVIVIEALEIEATAELVPVDTDSFDNYIYNDEAWTVAWKVTFKALNNEALTSDELAAYFDITEVIKSETLVGNNYKATISIALGEDYDADNFTFSFDDYEKTWEIKKATITLDLADLALVDDELVYNFEAQKVELDEATIVVLTNNGITLVGKDVVEYTLTGDEQTNVGDSYKAIVTFTLKAEYAVNYDFVIVNGDESAESAELGWKIVQLEVTAVATLVAAEGKDFAEYIYDGTEWTVVWNVVYTAEGWTSEALAEYFDKTEGGLTGTNAQSYTATIAIALKADDGNVKFEAYSDTAEWTIAKAEITVNGTLFALVEDSFEYTGSELTVALDPDSFALAITLKNGQTYEDVKDFLTITLTGRTSATVVGNEYLAGVEVVLASTATNYSLTVAAEAELDWEITPATLDIAGFKWVVDGRALSGNSDTYTYDAKEHTVDVRFKGVTLPAGITEDSFILTATSGGEVVQKILTVGVYVVDIKLDNYYLIDSTNNIPLTLTIEKAIIDVDKVKLDKTEFEYTGSAITVNLVGVPAGITATPNSQTETRVGNYTLKVTFTANDANYAPSVAEMSFDWSIRGKAGDEIFSENGVTVKDMTGDFDRDQYTGHATEAKEDDLKDLEDKIRDALGLADDQDIEFGPAYDINFTDKGTNEEGHPTGNFRVSVLIPEELREGRRNLAVIHVKDNGEVEVIHSAWREGNYMVFDATNFSVYAVIEITDKEANLWWLWLLIAIIIVLLIITIILLIMLLRQKNETPVEPEEEVAAATEPEPAPAPVEEVHEEEPVAEPAPAPVASVFAVDLDSEQIRSMLDRSFMARLSQADETLKDAYSEIKKELLSYKGVKSRISWGCDTFNKGRNKCVKLQIKGKSLHMYIALNPNELNVNKYHHKDVSETSKYAEVPTDLKVKSPRSIKYAKELIEILMSSLEIEKGEEDTNDYKMATQSTEALLQMGYIKIKQSALPAFWETVREAGGTAEPTDTPEPPVEDEATDAPVEEDEVAATEEEDNED